VGGRNREILKNHTSLRDLFFGGYQPLLRKGSGEKQEGGSSLGFFKGNFLGNRGRANHSRMSGVLFMSKKLNPDSRKVHPHGPLSGVLLGKRDVTKGRNLSIRIFPLSGMYETSGEPSFFWGLAD